MQVCHAYAELLCTPLFNRLYCNVHFFFFSCVLVLILKTSLWASHRLKTSFPTYSSWRWPLLFFNAFQKSMGDLAVMKTHLAHCAVQLCPISGCCACQGTYAKSIMKNVGEMEKKVIAILSAILQRTEKTYPFWKKSKYQSRFGHPELMCLLISLLAGSLAGSPVQRIHSGTKRSQFLLWEQTYLVMTHPECINERLK